jgi:glycosyltransferase involved in cell wall biosynthesis
MNYLFIHQNFPGQYRHLVAHLAKDPNNRVYFLTQPNENAMPGVFKIVYPKDQRGFVNCHAYAVELDRAITTGAMAAEACRGLVDQGFRPDLIVGHSGWGETLFIKDVFPDTPLLANFEFFYHARGVDSDFDPEFVSIFNDPSRLRARNGTSLLAFQGADWGHAATQWQRSLHPAEMQSRISALHEGVNTEQVRPDPDATFKLPNGRVLTCGDEVITYVARNLEPYRGFHVFMRALPQLLRRRKHAQVVIVGDDGVSYGAPPPPKSTFREMMLQEVGDQLDLERVHFMGLIDYASYLKLLQISSAHVYLTYPFVLSWSFLEAMACGCLIIGSSTAPVLEVLRDGENGITVDFFAYQELAERIEDALAQGKRLDHLRQAARATAVEQFDLNAVLLPRWMALLDDLLNGRRPPVDAPSVPGAQDRQASPRGFRPAGPRSSAPPARHRRARR